MTYARSVKFEINPGKSQEFKTLFANEVLPILKKQEGFQDEMVMVKENQGVGISLWNSHESLNKYQSTTYPEISKKLTPVLKSQPIVEVYEVINAPLSRN